MRRVPSRREVNEDDEADHEFLGSLPDGGGLASCCADAGQQAQHRRHHGRRRRHLEHRRLSPRHDGRPHAEPGQNRQGRHAVHRLLRRGELHRRARGLRHRHVARPHRHDHCRAGRFASRHAGHGTHHRHGAQVDGLCHRTVRQEPPGRPERVPAHRARLRRILRLPLSPRRDGRPGAPRLPAGAARQDRPAQHGAQLGHRQGRPDGDAALGQDRQAEDRGRRHALSEADGNRGRRDPGRCRSSSSTRPRPTASRSSCG